MTVAVCASMSVDTSATPGSSFSCSSTAVVHDVPQTMPSTKKVTDWFALALAVLVLDAVFVVPASQPSKPIVKTAANPAVKTACDSGFMFFSSIKNR